MNKRIRKKKQKLAAMHASNWNDLKLHRKRIHVDYIQSRHCMWGLIPHKDNYAMYLRCKRRRYGNIEPNILLARTCLMFYESIRKVAKEKLFVKEGNYNG